MKISFKHLVAAATFIAMGSAHAATGYDWTVTGGQASLVLSADAVTRLNLNATVAIAPPTIPATYGLGNPGTTNTAVFNRTTGQLSLTISGGTSAGDALTSVHSGSALVNFRRLSVDEYGDPIGFHSVFLTNWDIDVANSTIYATLYSRPGNSSVTTTLGKVAVFKATLPGLAGGTSGHVVLDSVDGLGQATGVASGAFQGQLSLTAEAADLILTNLNVYADGNGPAQNLLFRSTNWGTVSFLANLSGTPAVPEPSSYALIVAGLAALCFVKRQRA